MTTRTYRDTQKAGKALLRENRDCNGAVRWVRIRARAVWLLFRAWRVTRQLRAKKQRIEAQIALNERRLSQFGQRHAR
jgi:hypothetical protein